MTARATAVTAAEAVSSWMWRGLTGPFHRHYFTRRMFVVRVGVELAVLAGVTLAVVFGLGFLPSWARLVIVGYFAVGCVWTVALFRISPPAEPEARRSPG